MPLMMNDVPIESPCDADFSSMTRKEATRRFCGSCKKHVNDLSHMTETEARTLLAAPVTEGLCIRYLADERGQLHFLPDVPVSTLTRFRRAALAAAVLAAPLSLTACMGAAPSRGPELPIPQAVEPATPAPSAAPSASAAPAGAPPAVVATPGH